MTHPDSPTLVLGASGTVGAALLREGAARGEQMLGAARHGADLSVDVGDEAALSGLLQTHAPRLIFNAAALVSLQACEDDPGLAWRVNARPAAILASFSRASGARIVHVSTDHYYDGDGRAAHDEAAAISLVNEYARSKFAAEALASTAPTALIVRTNVTGFRGWPDRPTFAEWALDAIDHRKPMTLFDDFYTSTIDACALARALFDLAAAGVGGVINVASRDVADKREFVVQLASSVGVDLDWHETGTVKSLRPRRADSLGLDVGRAERLLGRRLPTLTEVCDALAAERSSQ